MNEICFIVYGEPQGKGRPRFVRTPYGVRTHTPEKTEINEARIGYVFKEEGGDFFAEAGEPVKIEIVAYHKIPASASNKKKNEMASQLIRPTKKPDWDNIGKIVTDALNGIAWHDDAQIVDARVIKRYTADKPKVVIIIRKGEDVA